MNALTDPFTMAQYIEYHKLGVSPHDIPAVRIISDSLRKKGYRRVKTRTRVIWTRKPAVSREALQQKLEELEC